jgi:hypothetical protein
MQEAAPTSPLQLLFIELRVGLARSAIQAALLLNGGGAVAILLFLAMIVTASGQQSPAVGVLPLKWALALFGLGMFIAGMTFVNAYIAQGAIASGRSGAVGTVMRRLGLGLIVASFLLFLAGVGLAVSAI